MRLREKRVSPGFVSTASEYSVYSKNFFFFFDKCFLLVEMTTKFNKDMYARMRGKKDEPLSALGTKSVRITDRGVPILAALPSSPTSAPARSASPTPSVEEVPPRNKRLRVGEKQKEKVNSRPSCVWA